MSLTADQLRKRIKETEAALEMLRYAQHDVKAALGAELASLRKKLAELENRA